MERAFGASGARRGPRRRALVGGLAVVLLFAIVAPAASAATGKAPPFQPIDRQNWRNQALMTWDEYKAVPGTNWADPSLVPTTRTFKGALVLGDFGDQPFVVTQPVGSTLFGNPQANAHDLPRSQVAQFYEDLLNTPSMLNHGQTINSYWMEDSLGRFGVKLDGFGPYAMDFNQYQYFLEFQAGTGCVTTFVCNKNFRSELQAKWTADVGSAVASSYDFIFFVSAGQDESSTWQEFGEMKWMTQEEVPDAWGPPDAANTMPNWVRTRYVPWTSWKAGVSIWPSAGGGSSTQAESSGMAVYAHEFSHILGIGDNYNNPFSIPARRAYTGPWDMLSRGSFNGPGGTHTRWKIPAVEGASLGSNHNLRNRMKLGIVDEANVLRLDRDQLDESGLVVGRVTARAADPGANGLTGFNIVLTGGDKTPACSTNADPFCAGSGYVNYTVEVVDRMGNDSFTPGHGVLFSRTKNNDAAPFVWITDANPQDIDLVDFTRPNGEIAKVTIGDPRQLNDATFNAGLRSQSSYEFIDQANRLHFYVVEVERSPQGVLSYTIAVRSLDGSGPQTRGVALANGKMHRVKAPWAANCVLPLTNTGTNAPPAGTHPEDVSAYTGADVYRISASIVGDEWTAQLYNALATVEFGQTVDVPIYVTRDHGSDPRAIVTVTAISESDPTKTATAACNIKVSNMNDN